MIMSTMSPDRLEPRAVRLADWGVLRARGDDAQSFLHGQLTSDMLHLDATQARLAGYCSAKGRLLASFVVWRRAPGEVLLACSAELLPATLKRLAMFVLRAKCRLDDASAELPLWGLTGEVSGMPGSAWQRAEVAGGEIVRLPDALIDGQTVPRALFAGAVPPAAATPDLERWRWLEVTSGVPRITGATVEQFVPQMVNLELVGGVDFQKGCYPGQEVVARSQYRGTLKRRAVLLEGAAPMTPGQEVFHDADPAQPAGMVVLGASASGRHAALVEIKLAALEGGTLHLGAAGGPPLQPLALPYALTAPA